MRRAPWLLLLQRRRVSILRGIEGAQRGGGAAGDGCWPARRGLLLLLLLLLLLVLSLLFAPPMPLALLLLQLCHAAS